MSPRLIIHSKECPHCEYDQSETAGGLVMATYICHHPDQDGCYCALNGYAIPCKCPPEEEGNEEEGKGKARG